MEIKYLKKKTLTHAVIHLVSMVKYLKHGLQIKWKGNGCQGFNYFRKVCL